jgi:cyanate lyase
LKPKLAKVLNPKTQTTFDSLTNHPSGLTFDEISKALGKDEVWVAAAFYGQVCLNIIWVV